ncbi:McrB family protein [Candidatus Avelusimicrobium fimicolum]|uniref:McrB family protein n=1 Tax=Candidatus Avelusimicrobium fimicolum TaxID=3416216 RepID=UPI003D0A916F
MIDLLKEFASNSKQWFYQEPEKRYELVKNNYQFFQSFFTKEKLENASWEELQQIGTHLHTLNTLPIARGNAFGKPNHELNYYRQQFINLLNDNISLQERIKNFKLAYFGNNSLGELLGYLFPNEYAIFNQRSGAALEILNIPMEIQRGEDFSEKFINFNNALTPLRQAYAEVVTAQTDLPLNLEIDQFLSWVEETHKLFSKQEPSFWSVGSVWGEKGDQRERFINNSIWECGYSLEGENRYEKRLNLVSPGDIFVLKSSATTGANHKTPITIIKNIGIVQGPINKGAFHIQWLNIPSLPHTLEGKGLRETIAPIKDSAVLNLLKNLLTEKPIQKISLKKLSRKIPLNQILYGPPGTGKTYHTITKAVEIIDGQINPDYAEAKKRFDELKAKGQIKFITFHQNYSYEDFMVGIRPDLQNGQISYKLYEGPFKQIADRAKNDSTNNYVMIIDEINRGNISKIFGELITLIETDKRAGNKHALSAPLLYQNEEFSVPNNLYIIGTMNTADKSIALVDIALRRRFVFEEMMPNAALLNKVEGFDLPNWFTKLNQKITAELDRDHQIGHSYFIGVETIADLQRAFYQCILPLLKEYFYGNPEKLQEIIPGFTSEEKLEGEAFKTALECLIK